MARAFGIFPRRGVRRGVARVLEDTARLAAADDHRTPVLWPLFVPGFMWAGMG